MSNDLDVLTRLRNAAVDGPALTLQADDLVRAGRRRRLRHRAVGAGAVLVAAGVVVGAVAWTSTDDSSSPGPIDMPVQPTREFDAHVMPAILKEAALSPFDEMPRWTDFSITPYVDDVTALGMTNPAPATRAQWNQASAWTLQAIAEDGALTLAVTANDPLSKGVDPATFCASTSDGISSTCKYETLPDGRVAGQQWLKPIADPGAADPRDAPQWWVRMVKVYDPDTGFSVEVREAAAGTSPEDASGSLWLTEQQLLEIATNPIVDLDGDLPSVARE